MSKGNKMSFQIGETVIAMVLLVASFLPWVSFTRGAYNNRMHIQTSQIQGSPYNYFNSYTAWNSALTISTQVIPNWLVIVAGLGIAVCSWLRRLVDWRYSLVCRVILTTYASIHVIALIILANSNFGHLSSSGYSIGIGLVLTLIMLVILVWLSCLHLADWYRYYVDISIERSEEDIE